MIVVSAPFGEFPNGVATVSLAVAEMIEEQNVARPNCVRHDSSGSVVKSLATIIRILVEHRNEQLTLYRPLSGGPRSILDMAVYMAACGLGLKVILHHHTYRYLNQASPWHFWLRTTRNAVHICLDGRSEAMLRTRFRLDRASVAVIDNSFAIPMPESLPAEVPQDGDAIVVGHLSSLSPGKGADRVIALCDDSAGGLRARIAGPLNGHLESEIEAAITRGRLEFLGPLSTAAEKREFFESIDVFVYLSSYRFEAQPVVIYEALAHGVPVLASDWAGIRDQLKPFSSWSTVVQGDDNVGLLAASERLAGGENRRTISAAFRRKQSDSVRDFRKAISTATGSEH